ncbi:response regulator [Herbaspirillum sp. GCM10030257]|uniref:response regulator n=1 Tax=Herbaspirillum sp. GCM10030257 TaxID=3273393 RepID=UPI00360F3659
MKHYVPAILLVEDDVSLRYLTSDILTALNMSVQSVSTAEKALELLIENDYKLLLADIHLPGMTGLELAAKAVAMQPQIKVLLTSGAGFLVADRMNFEFALLPKPYNTRQLQLAIRELDEEAFSPSAKLETPASVVQSRSPNI